MCRMKIVIDIPESEYHKIRNNQTTTFEPSSYIKRGTEENEDEINFIQPKKTVGKLISVDVLDKIRAEIEQEHNRLSATRADETLELGECLGLRMSLKIIDKYRKEQT